MTDHAALADLVRFARIELESHDLEPWAEVLRWLHDSDAVTQDEALWLVSLYNTYDDLASAWGVFDRWRSPAEWSVALDADEAAKFPCTQERRGLRGGKVLRRLDSYVAQLDGRTQWEWLELAVGEWVGLPYGAWTALLPHLRRVWGVGRQSAFEWAEFLGKLGAAPVLAPDACLWESEGPRRSLQRLYGVPTPSRAQLDDMAHECREHLADEGVPLSWEDFETVICDFNVMRDGRYYPGRHLAALREEIDATGSKALDRAWWELIPEPWCAIRPGIDKSLLGVYRDAGRIALGWEQ